MFGLREKKSGALLGFYATSNQGGDCCTDVEFNLFVYTDNVWLVPTQQQAQQALQSTAWYNADYTTPHHSYKEGELEVVEVDLIIK